jgi:hypothetical protein
MQLWFPSALKYLTDRNAAPPVSQNLDPELEFDPEVYPIGVSLAEGSIVGDCLLLCAQFYKKSNMFLYA